METFYSLQKLLAKLPFSILGYYEHEVELDNFFVNLCSSDFISHRNNIELVSYSYARLTDLNSWKTDSYSSRLFFHSLNEKYTLLALNIYYTLRNNLFERTEEQLKNNSHMTNNVAIALSRLFIKDVSFRLSYSLDENWHFSYYEQGNLFSIKLPLKRIIQIDERQDATPKEIFHSALSKFLSASIAELDSDEKFKNLIIQKVEKTNSIYEKKKEESLMGASKVPTPSPINDAFKEFRKVFKNKAELETLRNEIVEAIYFWHRTNPGYMAEDNIKKNIENWVELFFQIVFISLVYDSWVEYFPSICGVDEQKGKEYRNLGGLILGYKTEHEITQDERSLFRIISERISATVAGQWMFENNKELRRERNKRNLINAFIELEKLDTEVLHGKIPINKTFETAISEYFKKHEKVITKEFELSYKSLLKNNNNHCSKYCLFTLKSDLTPCTDCNVTIKNPLFSKKKQKKCCNENDLKSAHFNVPLIKALMESLITHTSGTRAKIKKNFYEKEISITITYKNTDTFNITEFISKLKDKNHNGSFIGKFFCDYYDAIDSHGIFSMEYFKDKKFVPFFNSRNSIKFVKPLEKIIEINETYPFPTEASLTSKKIKITFKNEL